MRSRRAPRGGLQLLARLSLALALLVVWLGPRALRAADDPSGYWTTIDDDGKTATSVVQIYAVGHKLNGKIVELVNPREQDPKCTACDGSKRGQPIIGMEILWGLEKDGARWSGGRILDPKNGKEYKCNVELVDAGKRLKVRGYIGIALFGRTQYWRRAARQGPR
jgi:uncharacterized protein (DUF2147 family)